MILTRVHTSIAIGTIVAATIIAAALPLSCATKPAAPASAVAAASPAATSAAGSQAPSRCRAGPPRARLPPRPLQHRPQSPPPRCMRRRLPQPVPRTRDPNSFPFRPAWPEPASRIAQRARPPRREVRSRCGCRRADACSRARLDPARANGGGAQAAAPTPAPVAPKPPTAAKPPAAKAAAPPKPATPKPAPESPPTNAASAEAMAISPVAPPLAVSRNVSAVAGTRFELPFEGTGWTYLGEKDARRASPTIRGASSAALWSLRSIRRSRAISSCVSRGRMRSGA